MKKYLLLVGLLSFLFLGLGNVSFALCFSNSDCMGGICNTNNGQCISAPTPSNTTPSNTTPPIGTVPVGGICTENLNCKSGLICVNNKCATDFSTNPNDCSACRKLSTPTEISAGCDSTKEDQKSCNNQTYCCPPTPGTPCEQTSQSVLNGDPNAIVVIAGITCECKKGYGISTSKTAPNLCQPCSDDDVCCGTKLNTKIPFIGNCIETTTQNPNSTINETTAFPVLVTALVKILISVILIASFVLIVVAGVMIASARDDASQATAGKKMIIKVAVGLAILGASGVILRLINPNFFG